MKHRRPGKKGRPTSAEDLRQLARETETLVDRLATNLDRNPERLSIPMLNTAMVRCLRNQTAILDALAGLLPPPLEPEAPEVEELTPADVASEPPPASAVALGIKVVERRGDEAPETAPAPPAPAPAPPPEQAQAAAEAPSTPAQVPGSAGAALDAMLEAVRGMAARAAVSEFDQRERDFERGLAKLNNWLTSGGFGLPFQKREAHAYLNRGALSEAMLARIEAELMGREGYSRRLGRLEVDGLEGEVVIYLKRS